MQSTDIIYIDFDGPQRKYLKFLGDSVKRPKMKGFATDRLILDHNGKLERINAKTITYEQNLVTSHILELELYNFHKKQ